ncbi:MAG: hypothetical protein ACR2K5_01435 [Pseudolabrys sp.]
MKKQKAKKAKKADTVGKRVIFDGATWRAVELLARDQMKDLPEITEEAFRDLLKKHGRSADLREALKLSARRSAANR